MLYIYDIYNVERISIYVIMSSTETSIPSIVKHKRDVFPTGHGEMIGICTSVMTPLMEETAIFRKPGSNRFDRMEAGVLRKCSSDNRYFFQVASQPEHPYSPRCRYIQL